MRNSNLEDKYCDVTGDNFPKWDVMDLSIWKLHKDDPDNYWGQPYLYLYKDSYIKFHRETIIKYSNEAKISPLLLANIAWQEAGGKPDNLKPQVLLYRQLVDAFKKNNDYSNRVSVGIVAMQIRVVAETLGIDPRNLSNRQQLQISRCLQDDDFNLRMVALHLHSLILHDFPDADTFNLNDAQIVLAGSRYNRGIERSLKDFTNALYLPKDDMKRDYISYGLALIKRRERIKKLMGINDEK